VAARQIAINAGEDGSIVVGKILEKDTYAYGYDAQAGEYGNLISKGIIDPTKWCERTAGCGVGRGPAHHNRSHGCRGAEEAEPSDAGRSRWRHGRNGRHGLLRRSIDHLRIRRPEHAPAFFET